MTGDPPVSFRVSPTYVLKDPMQNFIVGHELLDKLSGKAETWRLGNENSEDALSFNVFRSLQQAGMLYAAARSLIGLDIGVDDEPELIVWGHRLESATVRAVPELQAALDALEGTAGQQTEPYVILRIPNWGWIFIEAKLASPTPTYKGRKEKLKTWMDRYADTKVFNATALAAATPEAFPEQLLRNVAVAHAVAPGENIAVIALVRKSYLPKVTRKLADLRHYLADKSVNLRPAFAL